MKQDTLLEAMGMVDEQLLAGAESTPVKHRPGLWKAVLAAAIVVALAVSATAAGIYFASKPIDDFDVTVDEKMDSLLVDENGNILLGKYEGQAIFMEVDLNEQTPERIEYYYRLTPPEPWQELGPVGGSGDGWVMYDVEQKWTQEGREGEMILGQMIQGRHDDYGENCVDVLYNLKSTVQLTQEVTTVAGLEVLKVTVPATTKDDRYGSSYINCGGETRLYWSDGDYVMYFIYPSWVTDAEAEAILQTLYMEAGKWSYPWDYGTVNPDRIRNSEMPFLIEGDGGMVGQTAYSDGCIWFMHDDLYKYDPSTGTLESVPLPEGTWCFNMFATEHYICFDKGDRLWRMSKDGQIMESICEGVDFDRVDGMYMYSLTNNSRDLTRISLETGEAEVIAKGIKSGYSMDDQYIYAIDIAQDSFMLKISKEDGSVERIELTVDPSDAPVSVLCGSGGEIYFNTWPTQRIYKYENGEVTKLPMRSDTYQEVNGKLVYIDERDLGLKCYDPETEEITVLQENVCQFAVHAGRYALCLLWDDNGMGSNNYIVLDIQTGEITQLNITA